MRKRPLSSLAVLALFLSALVMPGSARAQFNFCGQPDDEPPTIHDFSAGPSYLPPPSQDGDLVPNAIESATTSELGTRVRAEVWDIPNVNLSNRHNGIAFADVVVPELDLVVRMDPEVMAYRIRQGVRTVLDPLTFMPAQPYTLRIVAEDTCGNRAEREWRIIQYTFAFTVTCEREDSGFVC